MVGGTLAAVQKAIRSGRIVADAAGKIDPGQADLGWAQQTDPALQPHREPEPAEPVLPPLFGGELLAAPAELSRHVEWPEWMETAPLPPPPIEPAAGSGKVVDVDSYQRAKTERERAEAEMAKLELLKRRGEVIGATEARKTFRAIGRMVAAARESLPAQLAPRLIGKTDLKEIEKVIRNAMREADERVATEIQSSFVGELAHAVGCSAGQ